MSRKGITPIISIIILLGITVALAGLAWTFLAGFLSGYTEKKIQIDPQNGVFCQNVSAPTSLATIRVFARNAGTTPLDPTDIVLSEIDGVSVGTAGTFTTPMVIGGNGFIIEDNRTGQGYSIGPHTVLIGIGNEVMTFNIYCS